jgi:thioredoxin
MSESEDTEIDRINKKKLEELVARRKAQMARQDAPKEPIVLSDSNFYSELAKHPLVVVDFWAEWCGPCRMVSPIIEQLASEYAGGVTFGKLNVDENPMVSGTFGVQSIPTIMVYKDGKPVDRLVGAVPKQYIESRFRPYLENHSSNSVYG